MSGKRRKRLRAALLAGVAAGAAVLALVAYLADFGQRLELDTVDARFSIRGEQPPPGDVVVVAIDDVSFGELAERWPFPRRYHARVIDRLREAGAQTIGYDVQFTEPSSSKRDDVALFEAAGRAGNVVFATTEVDERGDSNVLGGEENLRAISARAGNSLLPSDQGGVIRRVEPSIERLESFAFAVERKAGGDSLPNESVWIDYPGSPGTIPAVSFSRVHDGRFDPGRFEGKTVIVGPVAPSLQDLHPTSVGGNEQMSGAEIQAAAVATLRAGSPLEESPTWLDLLTILLMGMLVPVASFWLRPLLAVGLAVGVGVVYLAIAQLAFDRGEILLVVYPIAALALGAIGSLAVHYFTEVRERRRLRALFGRFVPEAVVDTVVDRAEDDLRLVGSELEATVMFTDLRGFTSASENLPAPRVFDILTEYHELMCEAVLDNGGTLVAYMGDGLMAVFGAPIEQDDHADRALRAGLEMTGPKLSRFNSWLVEQGLPAFNMGVGLNSGPVMSGNVGSARRLEYSAIGDTVNTAARIEQFTKDSPYMLLMSSATRALLADPRDDFMVVGETELRGREQAIELWSVEASLKLGEATREDATAELV